MLATLRFAIIKHPPWLFAPEEAVVLFPASVALHYLYQHRLNLLSPGCARRGAPPSFALAGAGASRYYEGSGVRLSRKVFVDKRQLVLYPWVMVHEDRKPMGNELRVEASGHPVAIFSMYDEECANFIENLSKRTRVFVEQFDGTRDVVHDGVWENVQPGRPVCPWCHSALTKTGCSNGLCEAVN